MTSLSAHFLWAAIVLGLCSASIQPPAKSSTCPSPCRCQNLTVACDGCPTSYVTISKNTDRLYIKSCKDVQYLLRLHQRHETPTKLVLSTLEIRDSYIRQPEGFIYNDFNVKSLILANNSIYRVNSDERSTNLTFLDLSHNIIECIDNRTFAKMNKLLYLDISANRIVKMESDCFSGLGKLLHLNVSSNGLTYLNESVFSPLGSLQLLNLSANKLETIEERSFSSLPLLQQLDISYNRLTSVAPGALQFLPNLAKLMLGDNPKLMPDAQIFVGTSRRLQQVDASRTGLSQVPEALTHSVRYLTLTGNKIAAVRCGDLDSYPVLHMLNFDDNLLFYIEDDALGRLEMLSQLHLDRNKLETVPKMLPDKLKYLSLDTNFVNNLTTVDFPALTGLKVLILSNNLISFIQENTFITLVSLEVLDLSNNPLKMLSPNTFSGPVSLKDLSLAHVNISTPAKDISFPVPSPEGIENLHLEFSPGLTRQLMADDAALAAMTRLQYLDVRFSNISTFRSDLLHFMPELKILKLKGNKLNCSDIAWLADWINENTNNNDEELKCQYPDNLRGKLVKTLKAKITHNEVDHINFVNATNGFVLQKKNGNPSGKTDAARVDDRTTEITTSSTKYSTTKENGRSKLLQIFSEWSQESYNHRDDEQKTMQPPCNSASGNSNGSENKTKCFQHPTAATTLPTEDASNTNIEASGFMYRKIGNDKPNDIMPTPTLAAEKSTENSSEILKAKIANLTEVGENASEYQTSRYRAEASTGNLGALAAAVVATAAGAALATAWAARRRPRPRPQDLMEVHTISAVGELW